MPFYIKIGRPAKMQLTTIKTLVHKKVKFTDNETPKAVLLEFSDRFTITDPNNYISFNCVVEVVLNRIVLKCTNEMHKCIFTITLGKLQSDNEEMKINLCFELNFLIRDIYQRDSNDQEYMITKSRTGVAWTHVTELDETLLRMQLQEKSVRIQNNSPEFNRKKMSNVFSTNFQASTPKQSFREDPTVKPLPPSLGHRLLPKPHGLHQDDLLEMGTGGATSMAQSIQSTDKQDRLDSNYHRSTYEENYTQNRELFDTVRSRYSKQDETKETDETKDNKELESTVGKLLDIVNHSSEKEGDDLSTINDILQVINIRRSKRNQQIAPRTLQEIISKEKVIDAKLVREWLKVCPEESRKELKELLIHENSVENENFLPLETSETD